MTEKFRQILLALCYLMAWGIPLVHECQVVKARSEHRVCLAECHGDRGMVVLHNGCRHHGHDEEHCAICQQDSVGRQLSWGQKVSMPLTAATQDIINPPEVIHASRIFRHVIHPRAP